jgi:cysteinyl-tRNA synthetase
MRTVNRERLGEGDARRVQEAVRGVDAVLGILEEATDADLDEEIERLVQERERLRTEKDWAGADALRDRLKEMGIVLEDTPSGVRWKRGGPVSRD